MTESLVVKNMLGVKDSFDINVVAKTEDKKVVIMKSWNGALKKLRYNEKEKCYIVEDEIGGK